MTDLIIKMRRGDCDAQNQLFSMVYDRLIVLARRMLHGGSFAVARWEQTGDLAHSSWFRLQRALLDPLVTVNDDTHFLRIAARHMRFELIDLYRKHTGECGIAKNHYSVPASALLAPAVDAERFVEGRTYDPTRLAAWSEFHHAVEALNDDDRTLVDLLWYQGLKQNEVARLLQVDPSTVKHRWRKVRIKLFDVIDCSVLD